MFVVACAAVLGFVQPSTPEAFRQYLVGEWKLNKRLHFKSGGISGKFEGQATFRLLDPFTKSLLAYNESGAFAPTSSSFEARETRNRLLYDFGGDEAFGSSSVSVLYDALDDEQRGSTEKIVAAARPLYALTTRGPGLLAITDEALADGRDEYRGEIEVQAPNAFLSTWYVSGPQQDGEILSLFRRVVPEA